MAFDRDRFAGEYAALAERVAAFIGSGGTGFEAVAMAVFEFQLQWNVGYRRFCEGVHIDGWKSIPAVPTAAFKDPDRPVACFPVGEAAAYFETSGTTGELRGRHYYYQFGLYRSAIDRGWALAGLPQDLPRHWLRGLGERSSLGYMLEHLSGRGPAMGGAFDEPVVLMGTALAFLHLFERGCGRLPEGSWVMETGGYKGSGREISREALYAMFEAHLGVPQDRMVNEYGMTELSSQSYRLGAAPWHVTPHWLRVVVRSPESGEEVEVGEAGYLSIYDLANVGSVMAISTQDIAVRRGDGVFELVGRDPSAIPRGCSRAADEFFSR